jgi:sulfatase modifying factor 1
MKTLICMTFAVFFVAEAMTGRVPPLPASPPAQDMKLDMGNSMTMTLVLIPAGKFEMGCGGLTDPRKDRIQHEVTIGNPFYMGATHVTVDQFAAFVKDSGYRTDAERAGFAMGIEIKGGSLDMKKVDGCSWRKPSFEQMGNHPVVQVSWNDARAFCEWLSKKTGKIVGLPTEAQWEYACRAGTNTSYPWGDNPDDGKGWANCRDQSNMNNLRFGLATASFFHWDDGFVFTSPVAHFKANAFALYDMIGNAKQWCQDYYGPYGEGAATDPIGPDTGRDRVLRGSSWLGIPLNSSSAMRSRDHPENRSDEIGFRISIKPDKG